MAISNEIEKLERRWQQTAGLVFAPLAEAYRKAGLHQRALDVLEQGLSLHPDYGPALIVRGRCHLDSGNLDQAETAFEHALVRSPMDPIAIRGIADVFARTDRVALAVERLRLLVDLDPRNDEARAALDRLLQYVDPNTVAVVEPEPPAPVPAAEPVVRPAPFEATPVAHAEPEPPPFIETLSLEPVEPSPAESDASFVIEPNSLVSEDSRAQTLPDPEDFRIESFAVEPLEARSEPPAEPPAPEPFAPISWTPAPVLDQPESEAIEPVSFTPAFAEPMPDASLAAPESRPEAAEAGLEPAMAESTNEMPLPELSSDAPPQEPVAEPAEPEYASAMLPSDEPEFAVATEEHAPLAEPSLPEAEAPPMPEPVTGFAEENLEPEPVMARADETPEPEPPMPLEDAPAFIVTESMAELFLKQGHRELALAVYRQLAAKGPVSERLSADLERIEAELSAKAAATGTKPLYAARATGGQSVEQLLQGVLQAQPPSPPSSVLPPAIEPAAGEPARPVSDTLPLSAVFGDEPVVAPRPEAVSPDPEPSFDEFFGAAPSPEPAPAGGGERNPEAEDLRQFNEWLKGLKR